MKIDKLPTSRHALEDQRAVRAAKTEVVFQRDIDPHVARCVGAVVQVTCRILVEDVDGWRTLLMMNSQNRENALDAASASKQMPGHGFGRIDGRLVGVVAQSRFQCVRFIQVA